jgi:hypothetical protein
MSCGGCKKSRLLVLIRRRLTFLGWINYGF